MSIKTNGSEFHHDVVFLVFFGDALAESCVVYMSCLSKHSSLCHDNGFLSVKPLIRRPSHLEEHVLDDTAHVVIMKSSMSLNERSGSDGLYLVGF
jgi:hypothetical protein